MTFETVRKLFKFPAAYTIQFFTDQLDQLITAMSVDQTVPLKFSNKLLELVPQARLTVIDNAGHIPHFELPAIFNPLLLEYLQAPLDP